MSDYLANINLAHRLLAVMPPTLTEFYSVIQMRWPRVWALTTQYTSPTSAAHGAVFAFRESEKLGGAARSSAEELVTFFEMLATERASAPSCLGTPAEK